MSAPFWKHCLNWGILKTSVKTALLVGSILASINHFEAILSWTFSPVQVGKIGLTYLVPFAVATYAAARHAQRMEHKLPADGPAGVRS